MTKLMTLPDNVLVYPAHGAGSLCGKNMRAERSSTIGTERLTNYALQIKSREEFIRQLTSNLPARPDYFAGRRDQSRRRRRTIGPAGAEGNTPAELKGMLEKGGIALDIRPG